VADRQCASAQSGAVSGLHTAGGVRPPFPGVPAEAVEFLRSAHNHDQQAQLHDQWAAETSDFLRFGFLHAAEAHRAAARKDREMGADVSRQAYPGR
jgi:hypothetical protein